MMINNQVLILKLTAISNFNKLNINKKFSKNNKKNNLKLDNITQLIFKQIYNKCIKQERHMLNKNNNMPDKSEKKRN